MSVDELLALLRDGQSVEQATRHQNLSREALYDLLFEGLCDDHREQRGRTVEVLHALAEEGDPSALWLLSEALRDEHHEIREQAVAGLGRASTDEAMTLGMLDEALRTTDSVAGTVWVEQIINRLDEPIHASASATWASLTSHLQALGQPRVPPTHGVHERVARQTRLRDQVLVFASCLQPGWHKLTRAAAERLFDSILEMFHGRQVQGWEAFALRTTWRDHLLNAPVDCEEPYKITVVEWCATILLDAVVAWCGMLGYSQPIADRAAELFTTLVQHRNPIWRSNPYSTSSIVLPDAEEVRAFEFFLPTIAEPRLIETLVKRLLERSTSSSRSVTWALCWWLLDNVEADASMARCVGVIEAQTRQWPYASRYRPEPYNPNHPCVALSHRFPILVDQPRSRFHSSKIFEAQHGALSEAAGFPSLPARNPPNRNGWGQPPPPKVRTASELQFQALVRHPPASLDWLVRCLDRLVMATFVGYGIGYARFESEFVKTLSASPSLGELMKHTPEPSQPGDSKAVPWGRLDELSRWCSMLVTREPFEDCGSPFKCMNLDAATLLKVFQGTIEAMGWTRPRFFRPYFCIIFMSDEGSRVHQRISIDSASD